MTTTKADRYATDWLAKAHFARRCNDLAEPWPAWSTGELLAVAVTLQDMRKLADLELHRSRCPGTSSVRHRLT